MLIFFCIKQGYIKENDLKSKFEQDSEILKLSKQSTRTNLRRRIRIYDYLKGENKKSL